MHDPQVCPASDVCSEAVAKALASIRARHRENPDLAHMTSSAISERVTALTLPPRPARDDWWLVGRVLDEIEDGKLDWRSALHDFYGKFSKDLEKADETIKSMKKMSIPTDEICEKCGAGMVIKFGRFGQFLACANYPECKNTREVASKRADTEKGRGA